MTNPTDAERTAAQVASEMHSIAPIGTWDRHCLESKILAALASAKAEGYRQGQEEIEQMHDVLIEVETMLSALQRGAMPPMSFARILVRVRAALQAAVCSPASARDDRAGMK